MIVHSISSNIKSPETLNNGFMIGVILLVNWVMGTGLMVLQGGGGEGRGRGREGEGEGRGGGGKGEGWGGGGEGKELREGRGGDGKEGGEGGCSWR